jgi:hypothetical protein
MYRVGVEKRTLAWLLGRITALGNGQVPVVAATAFRVLQQAVDD